MTVLVSVIIPTYNNAQFIIGTVLSVLQQTYSDVEVIVVDDHSQDETRSLLQKINDSRLRYLLSAGKANISAARNTGIKAARGEYIAFLDSDDLWVKNKLQEQVRILKENPNICMVSSNFEPIGDVAYTNNYIDRHILREYRDYAYNEVALRSPIVTSSVLVRRAEIVAISSFDEDPRFLFIEDWDCWLRLIQKFGPVRVLKSKLVYYRVIYSKNRNMVKVSQNALALLDKHQRLGYLNGKVKYKARARCHLSIGNALMRQSCKIESIKHYLKAIWFVPGVLNKLQCLLGVFLNCIPASLRISVIESLVRARSKA